MRAEEVAARVFDHSEELVRVQKANGHESSKQPAPGRAVLSCLQGLNEALLKFSKATPLLAAAAIGFAVMSLGDGATQLLTTSKGGFDFKRNFVSATWQGIASPFCYMWFHLMDWLVPGAALRALVSQIATTGLTSPLYLTWCIHIEAWAKRGDEPVDWAAVRARTLDQVRRELPVLYGCSFFWWLPVNFGLYTVVPDYLRILYISSASVLWGAFASYVAHRAPRAAEEQSSAG